MSKDKLFGDSIISSSDDLDQDFDLDSNGFDIDPNNESIFDLNTDEDPIDEEDLYTSIPLDEDHLFKQEPLDSKAYHIEQPEQVNPFSEEPTVRLEQPTRRIERPIKEINENKSPNSQVIVENPKNSTIDIETNAKTKKKRKKTPWIVLGILVLILLAVMGGYGLAYFMRTRNTSTPTPVVEDIKIEESDEQDNRDTKNTTPDYSKETTPSTPVRPSTPSTDNTTDNVTPDTEQEPVIEDAPEDAPPMDYDLEPEDEGYLKDYGEPDYANRTDPYENREANPQNVTPQENEEP